MSRIFTDPITGVVCGVRVEEVEDPLMRRIRYLDELVDELTKGKPIGKVLRSRRQSGPELRWSQGDSNP